MAVAKVEPVTVNIKVVAFVFLIKTFRPPETVTDVLVIEDVPERFIATIPPSFVTKEVPQLANVLLLTTTFEQAFRFKPTWVVVPETSILVKVSPATVIKKIAALAAVLSDAVIVPSVVFALVKAMFLRVTFEALFNSIPLADMLEIVPPEPSVVPVPFIVNEPNVFRISKPFDAPLAE